MPPQIFKAPRFEESRFAINFALHKQIRRKANDFEDLLKGSYLQPNVIPVPDEIDPAIPRLVFSSEHGFSQIVISQISITLIVVYSPDWQVDIKKGQAYLHDRTDLLFKLVGGTSDMKPLYSGLTTRVRIPVTIQESLSTQNIARKLILEKTIDSTLYDVSTRTSRIINDRFYSNVTIGNYRDWPEGIKSSTLPRLSNKTMSEFGVEVIGDFNDRYSYNEEKPYLTNKESAQMIIDQGIDHLENSINAISQ